MFKNVRRYQRYSISGKAVIRRRDASPPDGLTAQVNTISQGGMGFYSSVLMEKATPVSVELLFHAGEGMTERNILEGRIASVCSQDDDYYLGIAFDREISYERFVEMVG